MNSPQEEMFALCVREPGNELVAAECAALTGGEPERDGFALCKRASEVRRAATVRFAARLLAHAPTLDDLLAEIRRGALAAEDFRIEFHRLDKAIPVRQRESVIAVADGLEGFHPNLDSPKHRFALVVREDGFWFGEILAEPDRSYARHDEKPYHTSSSLPSRLARVLVNLVASPGDAVLDPCCGAGSILLEAAAIGTKPIGADWNPRMVGMSRHNLAHFGYAVTVERADARTWSQTADALVTDLPYGKNVKTTEADLRAILSNVVRLASRAVFVAGKDLSAWLEEAGYCHVEVFRAPKYTGFVRVVHRALSSVSCP